MADYRPMVGAFFASLMIRDSEKVSPRFSLNEVNCPAQDESPINFNRFPAAIRIALGRIGQAEAKLE
jgi:hypothetical protein